MLLHLLDSLQSVKGLLYLLIDIYPQNLELDTYRFYVESVVVSNQDARVRNLFLMKARF